MKTEKNLPINNIVEGICQKHISCQTINGHNQETQRGSKLTAEEVQQVVAMYIYGASITNMAKVLGTDYSTIHNTATRNAHRGLKIDFQKSKRKSLGKMIFTYDEKEAEKFYSTLPQAMKDICSGSVDKNKLIFKSKLRKSEMYL